MRAPDTSGQGQQPVPHLRIPPGLATRGCNPAVHHAGFRPPDALSAATRPVSSSFRHLRRRISGLR